MTTDAPNGYCPYKFCAQLFNNGKSLQTENKLSESTKKEYVKIYKHNFFYSLTTYILKFDAKVTWSTNEGRTWQKIFDT